MSLRLTLGQTLSVSPNLIGMMQVLQMDSQELTAYLQELALENPMAELTEPTPDQTRQETLQWLKNLDEPRTAYDRQDQPGQELPDAGEDTLAESLREQLAALALSSRVGQTAAYIVDLLDANGYLAETQEELLRLTGQSLPVIDAALAQLQTLDPAGVGARTVEECLALQLQRQGETNPLCLAIAAHHLEDLAAGRYEKMAKVLQANLEDVMTACQTLRALDPKPGRGFANQTGTQYILPDLTVTCANGSVTVTAQDGGCPVLGVSQTYAELLAHTQDARLRDYLRQKLAQVDQAQRSIETRKQNTLLCAQAIARRQQDFFLWGGEVEPMTLADIAADVQVHESTVSRAVRGRYLQCSRGVYPLRYFFSRSLEGFRSARSAKEMVGQLISQEDPKSPLSDSQLLKQMQAAGCTLSRRTVAKYRAQLGIPAQQQRKR